MVRWRFIFFMFSFLLLVVRNVYAGCAPVEVNGPYPIKHDIIFGNVIVQRDAPIGSVIGTVTITASNKQTAYCDGPGYQYEEMVYGNASSIPHVYLTNVEGVGIQDKQWNIYYAETPPTSQTGSAGVSYVDTADSTFSLVKLGPIKSGTLQPMMISKIYYSESNGLNSMEYYISNSNVTQVACTITTPKMIFPIGDVSGSEFGTTIGFNPPETSTQNLGLDCDADANINVVMNGTQNPDVSDTTVLALNAQGEDGIASGLGVQLLYDGKPLEMSKQIVMKKSAGGQELLPITARYYQTKTSVTTGIASTSATLQLTYQ